MSGAPDRDATTTGRSAAEGAVVASDHSDSSSEAVVASDHSDPLAVARAALAALNGQPLAARAEVLARIDRMVADELDAIERTVAERVAGRGSG